FIGTEYLARMDRQEALEGQIGQHFDQGRPADALKAVDELIQLEQWMFGEVCPDVARSYSLLAELQAELADFDKARAASKRQQPIVTSLYGPDHDEVANARVRAGSIERLAGLTPGQRQKYIAADKELRAARELIRKEKYDDALKALAAVSPVLRELLGEDGAAL